MCSDATALSSQLVPPRLHLGASATAFPPTLLYGTSQRAGRASVPVSGSMSSSSSLVDAYSVHAKVWFPDKEQGWISGEVTSRTIEGDQVKLAFVDDKGKVRIPLRRS